MIDNPEVVDGKVDNKIETSAMFLNYLESKGITFVVDPEGNVGLAGDLPETEEEFLENFYVFAEQQVTQQIENGVTPEEIIELFDFIVQVEPTPVEKLPPQPQYLLDDEPALELPVGVTPAVEVTPVEEVTPEQESTVEPEAPEGFFSSYYNWIFGTTTTEDKKPSNSAKPTPAP